MTTDIIEIIYNIIQLTYKETEVKPTKLFIGYILLQALNHEIMAESRYATMTSLHEKGQIFMDLEIITKDQFGNDLPITYIGVV
jgi:hypothetical protein